jgi:zinc finger protein
MKCQSCGVKFSDFYIVEDQAPRRFTFRVKNPQQLKARVIRSPTGSVSIPEFKFLMEPGTISKGFITNVEGILYQVESTLETLKKWNKAKLNEIQAIESNLKSAFSANFSFTLIIEDPTGKSGIVPVSDEDDLVVEPFEV